MPEFSQTSRERLATCHPKLQELFNEIVKVYDCTIVCGHRGQEEQDLAFKTGRSDKPWPEGKHNTIPSEAVDVAPVPLNWDDPARFYHFAGFVEAVALKLGIKIRWGGDWKRDHMLNSPGRNRHFNDLPHFEIVLES